MLPIILHCCRGFTLFQMLITIAILTLLVTVAWPSYHQYTRHTRLQAAHSALLENAHFMERFYQQHKSFKATSTTWPALPVTSTDAFCIRPQGLARGMPDGKFTLKAVAFDKNQEPRVIRINEALIATICETSTSACHDTAAHFSGGSATDRNCTLWP